ncbi:MAG: glycosyltransferase [Candidatus Hydrogenedentes bacterium]|nr:glycosyltransferase [Candidatus Hydrogenedentota bacterium]
MIVGVNLVWLEAGRGGGAEYYLRNVLAKMRAVQPDTRFVLFTSADNHDSFEGWDRECLGGGGLFTGIEGRVERAAKQRGADVLFAPLESAPTKSSIPVVVFALDLYAWESEADELVRKRAAKIKFAKRVCENAAAIVAPSEFVQRKYLELLGIPLNKVVVAPLGVSEVFAMPQPCFVQQPYLLVVGATRVYRNLKRLREVFDMLKDDFPHGLIVVGQPAEAEPADWGSARHAHRVLSRAAPGRIVSALRRVHSAVVVRRQRRNRPRSDAGRRAGRHVADRRHRGSGRRHADLLQPGKRRVDHRGRAMGHRRTTGTTAGARPLWQTGRFGIHVGTLRLEDLVGIQEDVELSSQ